MNGGGNLKNFESEYKKNRNEYYRKFIEKNNANIRKLEIIMN